ncbi:putative ribonuclease H-like domain-containing protein, partial [Tanacetum coccineum]
LTKSMNYKPVVAGNQSNGNAGTKACDDARKAIMETIPDKDYIDPPFSQSSKSSPDAGFKPSGDDKKKKDDNVNSTNNVNAASTNEVNIVSGKISIKLLDDPNMPALEDYSIFDLSIDDQDNGAEADMNNLDTTIHVSPILTIRIHKDHPVEQIIRYLNSAPQIRILTKNLEEHEEPKKVIHALKDPSWIEAMQEELLQFKLQEVWTLVELPNGKRAIGTKRVFRNKKDERGIVIKNKARLVAQWYTQEEGIEYDEVFAPVARIEAIRLFLTYASFKDFMMYQMDVKSAFLYGKIEKEVYVCQPPRFEDPDFPDRVYKVEKTFYGLHQTSIPIVVVFSRWNNANAKKHIQKQQSQQDIETHLRFNKRFQTANNITKLQPPQTTVPPPFKSAGTPSLPSRPSIPGKKSKYSKPINPNPRNPSYDDHDSFSGEPSWNTAASPPLLSGRSSKNPDAQNPRKPSFERPNPRNPSFENHDSFSGERSWKSAAAPPLRSGRLAKNPDSQNARNPNFGKYSSFSGEPSWKTAGETAARYPSLNSRNPNNQHPAFKRIVKMRKIESEIDDATCVKVDEKG